MVEEFDGEGGRVGEKRSGVGSGEGVGEKKVEEKRTWDEEQ